MPLVRYEIRNEYSLANPELYRAAAKDEPEGLLEGVAMAGLVGIVRQLGDLAEFAAEVFHDLHEEVMATATRGHELLIRIQQLEAELPAVENFVFSETNQLDFAYTSGADWHASIRNDQNHLTRGDLPWFIRNSYEECRGPPRLFLLDKFDIAGAGACLKRYTDPSFFKMEWASSELSKAEKEQQDRKARRIKKKGRRRRNGEINDTNHVSQMHPRVRYSSLNVENVMGASGTHIHNLNTETQPRRANDVMHKAAVNDHLKAASSKATLAYNVVNLQSTGECNVEIGTNNVSKADTGECNGEIGTNNVDSGALKISALDIEAEVLLDKFVKADYKPVLKEDEQVSSERKPVSEVCEDVASEAEHFVDALTTMESEVETDTESKVKLDGIPHDETFDAEKDLISIRPVSGNLEPFTRTQSAWSPSSPVKSETSSPPLDEDDVSSIDENNVTPDTDKKDLSPPFDENCASPTSEDHLEGGRICCHVTETPPHSETSDQDDTQLEDLSGSFHFLPEPAIPLVNGDNNGKSGNLGSLLSHMRAKSTEILNETSSGLTEERSGSDEPENVQSKTPEEFSPHSLAESTIIEPLRVAIECSKIQEDSGDNDDEDDGMDGMQVSSNSSLSSPSMISTPRLSLLATSELHMVSEDEAKSPLSSKSSLESSPRSPIFSAIHSPLSPVNLSPVLSSSSELQMQSLHSELLEPCSPTLGPTFAMSELEVLPPPPPLPPLEWRIMRPRRSSSPSTASTAMEAPLPPAPPIPPIRPEKLLRNFAAPVPPILVEMVLQDLVPPPIRAEKILQDPVPPISPIRPEKPVQDPILPIPPIRPEKVLQDPAPSIPRPEKVIQDPVPPVPPLRPEKAIHDPVPLVVPSKLERRDSLIEAIASHDKSMLKKVTEQNQSYRSKPVDDREVLLEQIRTRSFSLRRTVVEKPEAPRPLTNINVAAILEKANAIRQAFAGSDEDEDYDDNWSDT